MYAITRGVNEYHLKGTGVRQRLTRRTRANVAVTEECLLQRPFIAHALDQKPNHKPTL